MSFVTPALWGSNRTEHQNRSRTGVWESFGMEGLSSNAATASVSRRIKERRRPTMPEQLIWGWSTGGHKSHAWEIGDIGWWMRYVPLCHSAGMLWTTEKAPGDERTRCKRCMKLVQEATHDAG
jgi:hypothetical protein